MSGEAETFAHFHSDPDLPSTVRVEQSRGGVIATSDTDSELLEIEWMAGDELQIDVGAADAFVRVKVGSHSPKMIRLRRGASSTLQLGPGVGYGDDQSASAVYPFVQGDGGHLRFLEIVPLEPRTEIKLALDPSDRLLLCATHLRFVSTHVSIVDPAPLITGPRGPTAGDPAFRGDCTVIIRDARLSMADGSADLPKLVVEGSNQLIGSALDGCSATNLEVHPIGLFVVQEWQRTRAAALLPRSALVLEPGAQVGSIRGRPGQISDLFDKEGDALSGHPILNVDAPDNPPQAPAKVRNIEHTAIRLEEGNEAGATLSISGQIQSVLVVEPVTTRKASCGTLHLTDTATAESLDFRTGRLVDHHDDAEECHRHVNLSLQPNSVVTNATGSAKLVKVAGATLHADRAVGMEICSVADEVDFAGASIAGAILALDQPFAAAIATKASSAQGFDAHPLTWSHSSSVFNDCRGSGPDPADSAWQRALFALKAVVRRDDKTSNRFGAALQATEALSRTNGRNLEAKAGLRYALLAFRQTTSSWRSERLLLLIGRSMGFGLRIVRPIAAWMLFSVVLATVIAAQSDLQWQWSLGGIGRYLSMVLDTAIEPSSLIRGASSDGALSGSEFSEAARFGARVLLALPFGCIVLAILRRTTWTRD